MAVPTPTQFLAFASGSARLQRNLGAIIAALTYAAATLEALAAGEEGFEADQNRAEAARFRAALADVTPPPPT